MQGNEQTTTNNEVACDFWNTNPLMAYQRQSSSACGGGESTQLSSTATADLTDPNSTLTHLGYQSINRCSLLPLDAAGQQQQAAAAPVAAVRPQQMPMGILHNSISIPVALSNHLQQQQQQSQQQHTCINQRPRRQLSQEIIGQNICYPANSESPYITLNTTNGRLSCQPGDCYQSQRQYICNQQPYHLNDIPPPTDFAHDYRRFKDTYCLDGQQKDANELEAIRQSENGNYNSTVPKHHQKQKVKFEQN